MSQNDKIIPKGLQLHIHTWENDGDNSSTQILSGLSKEDVQFYVELINLFKGKLGNDINSHKLLCDSISPILNKHRNIQSYIEKDWLEALRDEDAMVDVIYEILGSPADDGYDYGFCRNFEYFEVYEIPEEIAFVNVTDKFKN